MVAASSRRVIRSDERARTATEWLESRHSFSFGDHYDPDNTHHGVLLAFNEDVVAPGAGFDTHRHRDMEVLTWVVSGTMVHSDSDGHSGVLHQGLVQRMSAGSGTEHTERNDPWPDSPDVGAAPAHLVQSWVIPDRPGGESSYQQHDVTAELGAGELVLVASGDPGRDPAIGIGNRDASLHIGRPAPRRSVALPVARFVHLFVVAGEVELSDGTSLSAGDTVRFTDHGAESVTASSAAEIMVWEMHRGLTDQMTGT
ncbi:pirin family protein [Williamsia phyllosphaerae]|uniref:Quercetin 2,3-dioxygenase n=1 Tax=Williamsia phyllosphaerae TaxID=885042 RepID=A0ABQ1UCK8_9NOCA|nr:pirin-like bicupin family protein [Williamsia phyllosphaerae]GGF14180.1 putative quercetin 2,3-dioxygenase [Williamsia phyllosphaerae]